MMSIYCVFHKLLNSYAAVYDVRHIVEVMLGDATLESSPRIERANVLASMTTSAYSNKVSNDYE